MNHLSDPVVDKESGIKAVAATMVPGVQLPHTWGVLQQSLEQGVQGVGLAGGHGLAVVALPLWAGVKQGTFS